MIDNINADQPTGLDQSFCQREIVTAWIGVAGGMIVEEKDAAGIVEYGLTEDLSRLDGGLVLCAAVQFVDVLDRMAGVEADKTKNLMAFT